VEIQGRVARDYGALGTSYDFRRTTVRLWKIMWQSLKLGQELIQMEAANSCERPKPS
jgi:hypothetical protein